MNTQTTSQQTEFSKALGVIQWATATTTKSAQTEAESSLQTRVDAIVVLSHGRFDPADAKSPEEVTTAKLSTECGARVRYAVDHLQHQDASNISAEFNPIVFLCGATQQLTDMENCALAHREQVYNQFKCRIKRLDAQPFPAANTVTQFQAINQLLLDDPCLKRIQVLTCDYHVARCQLYAKKWLDDSIRDRVDVVGIPWATNPAYMSFEEGLKAIVGELERCALYTRKGDLAWPF